MEDQKRKPVAVCTNCGTYSFNVEIINGPCRRPLSGNKKCRGTWGSALNITDWDTCQHCKGSGDPQPDDIVARDNRTFKCTGCQGTGWSFVRGIPKHMRG